MTNTLEPRKKIRALRTIIYTVNRRKANDILREIQAECAALEIQVEELAQANENLLMENVGVVEMREALKYYLNTVMYDPELVDASGAPIPVEHWTEMAESALAAPDIEVPL